MAFMECRFNSAVLLKAVSMNVIVPLTGNTDEPRKVMYLLHGLSDDSSMWFRRSSIERYADRYNMVVIMPDGGRSFYTDAVSGENYWTFISEELPQTVKSIFNLSPDKEHTFAAGLSMGGYGALKLALKYPDTYSACGAFSAVPDPMKLYTMYPSVSKELGNIFGSIDEFRYSDNDVYFLSEKRITENNFPKLYLCCGKGDFLNTENCRYKEYLENENVDFTADLEDPGDHEWGFWDNKIRQFIRFLPISRNRV